MELFASFFSCTLFALACNLDTALLACGYAAGGMGLSRRGGITVAALTTAVTFLSLVLGKLAAGVLRPEASSLLGSLVLAGMGLWFLLDNLRTSGRDGAEPAPPAADTRGWVALAAALAVNNAGAGVAAGVSGLSPLMASGCNFGVTLLCLPLGRWLGRAAGEKLGKYALPLSGVLLLALALWEAAT